MTADTPTIAENARRAEMRWMSMEDATITVPARQFALMSRALVAADWYITCLGNVRDNVTVRGLDEARAGWEAASASVDGSGILAGDADAQS